MGQRTGGDSGPGAQCLAKNRPNGGLWALLVGVGQAGKGSGRESPARPQQEQPAIWGAWSHDANLLSSGILPFTFLCPSLKKKKKNQKVKRTQRGEAKMESCPSQEQQGREGGEEGRGRWGGGKSGERGWGSHMTQGHQHIFSGNTAVMHETGPESGVGAHTCDPNILEAEVELS